MPRVRRNIIFPFKRRKPRNRRPSTPSTCKLSAVKLTIILAHSSASLVWWCDFCLPNRSKVLPWQSKSTILDQTLCVCVCVCVSNIHSLVVCLILNTDREVIQAMGNMAHLYFKTWFCNLTHVPWNVDIEHCCYTDVMPHTMCHQLTPCM